MQDATENRDSLSSAAHAQGDDAVVMEQDFYALVAELLASRCAVTLLAELLMKSSRNGPTVPPMLGAGVILEGVSARLDIALNMAVEMGQALQFEQVFEHAGGAM